MSLSAETAALQRAAHELMYLGVDGSPIYSDDLSRRNGEVYRLTTALYDSGVKGSTVEEQANVCLNRLSWIWQRIFRMLFITPDIVPAIRRWKS